MCLLFQMPLILICFWSSFFTILCNHLCLSLTMSLSHWSLRLSVKTQTYTQTQTCIHIHTHKSIHHSASSLTSVIYLIFSSQIKRIFLVGATLTPYFLFCSFYAQNPLKLPCINILLYSKTWCFHVSSHTEPLFFNAFWWNHYQSLLILTKLQPPRRFSIHTYTHLFAPSLIASKSLKWLNSNHWLGINNC